MPLLLLANRKVEGPDSALQFLLLAGVLLAIAGVMYQRAGPAFATFATLAGLATYLLDHHIYLACAILLAGLLARPLRGPRRSWPEVLGAFGWVGLGFVLYELGRAVSQGSAGIAGANAERLVDLEQRLHFPNEASLQRVVLPHVQLVESFNFIYSFMFLSFIMTVLFWLFLTDMSAYRIFRNSLGWSALFTVAISAAVPVAPPRLVARSGLADTLEMVGRHHGFVNQYAALPSLHVGWSVLAGTMVLRTLGGRLGWLLGIVPAVVIAIAVIVTGNHYWLDGLAGIAVCLFALALSLRLADRPVSIRPRWLPVGFGREALDMLLHGRRAVRLACLVLTGILAYLFIGQIVSPGFTDHWGYFPPQVSFYLAVAIVGETLFRRDGGLFAWQTLFVAVAATSADVFGTSEDFYANFNSYDKIVHFFGAAAFTAVVIDILLALSARGRIDRSYASIVVIGVACGIAAGITWEIYEYVGDHVFHSARTGGWGDTSHDILFDSLGALLMGLIAANRRWPFAWRQALLERNSAEGPAYREAGAPDSRPS